MQCYVKNIIPKTNWLKCDSISENIVILDDELYNIFLFFKLSLYLAGVIFMLNV